MKRFLPLLSLLLLLPIAFAQCDPKECSKRSQFSGNEFCRYDDLYSSYVEYYCSGDECVSRVTEKLVEDCRLGCTGASCVTCNSLQCEAKSGYYSERYCSINDVARLYREYYCDYKTGCAFNEYPRIVEDCEDDVSCSQGRCGLCDPIDCNAKDNFYDNEFCKAEGNVYKAYRDYACRGDKCEYAQQDVKIADCPYSCSDGKCLEPKCLPSCETKDSFIGNPYCRGSSVYKNYRDYFCGIGCEFNETEKLIEDCKECKDGKCVVTKAENERLFEFDIEFSNDTAERNITLLPRRIFNGFLFGSNDMKIDANALVKSVGFFVLDTNKLGELGVYADDEKVYATNKLGLHNAAINRNAGRITISSASSGLIFWMPAVYDIGLVVVTVQEPKIMKNEFSFSLANNEYNNLKTAEIISWPAGTRISINGNVLDSSILDKSFVQMHNKIEFLSLLNETFSRKAVLKIIYGE